MNKGLLLLLASTGLTLAAIAPAEEPARASGSALAASAAIDVAVDDESTTLSDCDPKEVRHYCAYRSKCRAVEGPGSYTCRKGDTFVARIPKRKKDLVPKCRTIRAEIRKACH